MARGQVSVAHFYGTAKPWETNGNQAVLPALCQPEFDGYFSRGVQPLLAWWRSLAGRTSPVPGQGRPPSRHEAFATALADDSQLAAALTLWTSLQLSTPGYPLIALLPPSVSGAACDRLERAGISVRRVPWVIPPGDVSLASAASLARLRLWQLTPFHRVVYLAPTAAVMQDVSDLFERPTFAAAPLGQRPDTFHGGVLVLAPSGSTYREMEAHARREAHATFRRCLNGIFPDWYASPAEHRIPQRDAFELKSFLYLSHTELLPRLLAEGQLRVVDFAPFVYADRAILVPDVSLPAEQALRAFRQKVCADPGGTGTAVPGPDLRTREALLDEESADPGWAARVWRSRWQTCRAELGIDGPP